MIKPKTRYFQHDYNARHDVRLRALRMIFGCCAMSIYWTVVEMLHEEGEHKLNLSDYTLGMIAEDSGANIEVVRKYVEFSTSSSNGIFCLDEEGRLYSKRVLTNFERQRKANESKSKLIGSLTNADLSHFKDLYNDFCLKTMSAPGQFNQSEIEAAKRIMNYLHYACSKKNVNVSPDDVIGAWSVILDNYDKWDKFHKGQLSIAQISKNIINIINSIKNGSNVNQKYATDPNSIGEIVRLARSTVNI